LPRAAEHWYFAALFYIAPSRTNQRRLDVKPERVRLSVKRGMAPAPGSYVEVKALLDPPLQPLEPGGKHANHVQ